MSSTSTCIFFYQFNKVQTVRHFCVGFAREREWQTFKINITFHFTRKNHSIPPLIPPFTTLFFHLIFALQRQISDSENVMAASHFIFAASFPSENTKSDEKGFCFHSSFRWKHIKTTDFLSATKQVQRKNEATVRTYFVHFRYLSVGNFGNIRSLRKLLRVFLRCSFSGFGDDDALASIA